MTLPALHKPPDKPTSEEISRKLYAALALIDAARQRGGLSEQDHEILEALKGDWLSGETHPALAAIERVLNESKKKMIAMDMDIKIEPLDETMRKRGYTKTSSRSYSKEYNMGAKIAIAKEIKHE